MGTYASLTEFNGGVRKKVEAVMFQGEQFLGAIDTYHLIRLFSEEILILTDQRIILYKKGLIRESTTDYDRDRIANVSFDKGIIQRELTVRGSGFSHSWRVPISGGQEFAAAIRAPEPQPVYPRDDKDRNGNSVTETSLDSEEADSSEEETKNSQGHSDGRSTSGIDSAKITNPNAEMFGFDRWHYVAGGAAILGVMGVVLEIQAIFTIMLVVAAVTMYIDILQMRKASTWNPRAWLYELGILVGFLGVATYLFNRYRIISNSN